MKKLITLLLVSIVSTSVCLGAQDLRFNPDQYETSSLTMPDGTKVSFKSYEGIYYVRNIEDSLYQTLNIYVPDNLREDSPIFLRTYIGGYMASTAKSPSATDASGRALREGYVVCIPGSRGSNSKVMKDGQEIYTGKAPNGLLDLKAAVRYLKFNDDLIPGNSNKIITDGTSAGGAMSSLVGATGNYHEYETMLKKMGAADATDDIWAAVCYCPITDLNHADMEYEWLYGCTNTGVRHLDEAQIKISNELASLCPDYINSLKLKDKNGNDINSDNYKEFLKSFLIASAQKAKDEGVEVPDSIGFIYYSEKPSFRDGRGAPSFGPGGRPPRFHRQSEFIVGLDLDKYLSYVASVTPLKIPPAFDSWGVLTDFASPENQVFGNTKGEPANFTDFSLEHHLKDPKARLLDEIKERVKLMNPMDFIDDSKADKAPHWYIRHGAKDRDTSFLVPVNLATKLSNAGYDVNFFLPWNRPHSGDYNLNDLFEWLDSLQ